MAKATVEELLEEERQRRRKLEAAVLEALQERPEAYVVELAAAAREQGIEVRISSLAFRLRQMERAGQLVSRLTPAGQMQRRYFRLPGRSPGG